MTIELAIKHLLATTTQEGWGQMSRKELVQFAKKNNVACFDLFADTCLCIGIGDGLPHRFVRFNYAPKR